MPNRTGASMPDSNRIPDLPTELDVFRAGILQELKHRDRQMGDALEYAADAIAKHESCLKNPAKRLLAENAKLKEERRTNPDTGQLDLARMLSESEADRDRLKGLVEKELRLLPGWRELIAEWDDHGKDEALGQAMWAALDQIDTWRKEARAEAKGGGK